MYYIGVDLGGTTIKAGLVNEQHEIVLSLSAPTGSERAAEEVVADMVALCKKLMHTYELQEKDIYSVGVGCPGLVQSEEGIVISSSNLNFEEVNIRSLFNEHYKVPVYVENDANCAALGEVLAGAAKGSKSAIIITLGTGVGGGIIKEGKIETGAFFGAGEIGHQVINFNETKKCGCGRRGCYEQYASASALVRMAKAAAEKHPSSLLIEKAKDHKIEFIDGKAIFGAAHENDSVALEVLDEYYHYIAYGAANLINVLEPEMLVIGGGISAQGEYITKPVEKYIQEQMYGGLRLKTQIKAAKLGNDAGIIGAALLGATK